MTHVKCRCFAVNVCCFRVHSDVENNDDNMIKYILSNTSTVRVTSRDDMHNTIWSVINKQS